MVSWSPSPRPSSFDFSTPEFAPRALLRCVFRTWFRLGDVLVLGPRWGRRLRDFTRSRLLHNVYPDWARGTSASAPARVLSLCVALCITSFVTSLRTISRDLQTGSPCQLRTCTRFARLCYSVAGPAFSLETVWLLLLRSTRHFRTRLPRLTSIVDDMDGHRQSPSPPTRSNNSPRRAAGHLHRVRLALLCPSLPSTSTAPIQTPRLAGPRSNSGASTRMPLRKGPSKLSPLSGPPRIEKIGLRRQFPNSSDSELAVIWRRQLTGENVDDDGLPVTLVGRDGTSVVDEAHKRTSSVWSIT